MARTCFWFSSFRSPEKFDQVVERAGNCQLSLDQSPDSVTHTALTLSRFLIELALWWNRVPLEKLPSFSWLDELP